MTCGMMPRSAMLRGDGSADVVRRPIFHTRALIEHRLAVRPCGEAAPRVPNN